MGWRFKKRIKIFPGLYINISKSGISANVGVKGANVTFGPDGTYVNTGISGTGLYRRDKVLHDSKIEKEVSATSGAIITDTSGDKNNQVFKRKPLTPKTDAVLSAYYEAKEKGIPYNPKVVLADYIYPTLNLLKTYENKSPLTEEELYHDKNVLVRLLYSFGVQIREIRANVGPSLSFYEIALDYGCNVSQIKGLEDDIALALCSHNVRIIAPIPGKGTVGIVVPNKSRNIVSMRSMIDSCKFQNVLMELPIALGKTITNEVFMVDLAKTPHLLIAGAAGQGKSVSINAMIASLLYKKHPVEMKLVLMDPCGLELGSYSLIENHFLLSFSKGQTIISNSNQAVDALNSLSKEMEKRYELLSKAKSHNIKEYNSSFVNFELSPTDGHKYLPYIVVVIDEFGNFIEERGSDFEQPLTRLAQFADIVGIHLIISTKIVNSEIITRTIKNKFPTRIAFRVPERSFSQVILDSNGAEELLGNGDMLFRSGKDIDCVRVQGTYIDTYEVDAISHVISKQKGFSQPYNLQDSYNDVNDIPIDDSDYIDNLFEDAARAIILTQQGSPSMLQRRFSIGYNRAGRLMDQLEKAGVVGPDQDSGYREVLLADENSLMYLMNKLREQGAM